MEVRGDRWRRRRAPPTPSGWPAATSTLLDEEDDGLSGAFLGEAATCELLRARPRASSHGSRYSLGHRRAFRQGPGGRRGEPGVFFASDAARRARDGYRYWRYVEADGECSTPTEMLRRINPGRRPADLARDRSRSRMGCAAAPIVEEHNRRADPRAAAGRDWSRSAIRARPPARPDRILPDGAETRRRGLRRAELAVRRALKKIAAELARTDSRNEAAVKFVELVDSFGLARQPTLPSCHHRGRHRRCLLDGRALEPWVGPTRR